MCNFMPYSDFTWYKCVENINVLNVPNNSETGYTLEVDIQYPQYLHDLHVDLPFCLINKYV